MSDEKVTVYEKPTCSTCKKLVEKLEEQGVDFEKVDYYDKPLTKKKLAELLKKANMKPKDVLRKRSKEYKELDFMNKSYTDDQILGYLIHNPDLLERPFVERGSRAVLARPIDKVDSIF